MEKQKDFHELKRTFDTEVLGIYDHKLRGNYFIHQHGPNSVNKGIEYTTRGKELAVNGAKLIDLAVNLYAIEILGLLPKLEGELYTTPVSESTKREELRDRVSMLHDFDTGMHELSDEQDYLSQSTYLHVYPAISHFSEKTPLEYRQGLGEMVFHQLRLLNMCHLGELDPWQFRSLDQILQFIPDKNFLGVKRIQQLGEGLVREVLKSKDDCRVSAEARQSIQRYALQNEDLIDAVEKMEAVESGHRDEMDRLEKALKKQKEDYKALREVILSTIGEKMHQSDSGHIGI